MTTRKVFSIFFMILILGAAVSPLMAVSWETPITIAGKDNHAYYKPEIVFGPSGAVYTAYREKNKISSNSDIMLCIWDGKDLEYENVSNLTEVWEKYDAEESDIFVDQDETIHVAWIGADRNAIETRHVMYRYKQDDTWSEIFYLGELHLPSELQYLIDTRIVADSMGNAHVVTCIDAEVPEEDTVESQRSPDSASYGGSKTSWYFSKYGDTITPPYQFPGNKAKHPDVAVTDDYVHVTWMYKTGWEYSVFVQKWENQPNAVKGDVIRVTSPSEPFSSQKSRIDVDHEGRMHVIEFYKTGDVKKLRYFKEQVDGTFDKGKIVSQNQFLLYHKADLRVKGDSVIVSMQQGQSKGSSGNGAGVWFNWKQDGQWDDCTFIPGSEFAVYPSNDLNEDGDIAAIAWSKKTSQIMMTSTAPITATGKLEAQFTQPGTIFWGSQITFDASQCAALNPDYIIAHYTWDFGDGIIETTSGPTITHTYDLFNVTLPVTLTLTAENGDMGLLTKEIHIDALYGGIITSVELKHVKTFFFNRPGNLISWNDNPLNEANGYPAISGYEIWRAPQASIISDNSYVKVGEVPASEHTFLDYAGVQEGVTYVYAIRSVDVEGHISPISNVYAASAAKKDPGAAGIDKTL